MEDGRGIFEGWLVDHIKNILIGCVAGGGIYVLGHWVLASHVPVGDVVATFSKVWDALGIGDGVFFAIAVVNYVVQWIRKLSNPY
jgi:hypothetical protein